MKQKLHYQNFYSNVRLPEIIVWVISLLIFISIIYGFRLNAQGNHQQYQDTLWLKTGEEIPCLVYSDLLYSNVIVVQYLDESGHTAQAKYNFYEVVRVKQTSTKDSRNQFELKLNIPVRPKIYIGMGGGFPSLAGVSANVLLKNNMGGSFQFRYYQAKNYDRLYTYSLCFMKVFTLDNTRLVRLGLEGGLAFVNYHEAHNVRTLWGFESASYYTTTNSYGITLRAKVEFPIFQAAGLEIALPININKYKPVFGIELYLTLGRVRDRKKSKK